MRSNIYLASDAQRPEQDTHLRNKYPWWPRSRDAKMAQMPDVYQVKWGSLTDEAKVRGDVDHALSLGITNLQYDWEPLIDTTKPDGSPRKVPPMSYIHVDYKDQAECDNKWQQQLITAGEWIHDQSDQVQWGVYDLPVTYGDSNLGTQKEIDSVNYNITRCMTRKTEWSRVGPGCLQSVDYLSPVMYRAKNFTLTDRHPSWTIRCTEMDRIMKQRMPDHRVISWIWAYPHPHAEPRPVFPIEEWAVMLAKALEIGDVMVYFQGDTELTTDNPHHAEIWNQWNKCTA